MIQQLLEQLGGLENQLMANEIQLQESIYEAISDFEATRLAGRRDVLPKASIKASVQLGGQSFHPEEVALEKVEGLAPDVHLLVGRHLDLPVALGLVRVVP